MSSLSFYSEGDYNGENIAVVIVSAIVIATIATARVIVIVAESGIVVVIANVTVMIATTIKKCVFRK